MSRQAFIARIANASEVRSKVIIKEPKGRIFKSQKKKKASLGGKSGGEGIERDRGRDSKSLFAVLSSFVVAVSCACTFFLYLDGERVFFDFSFFSPLILLCSKKKDFSCSISLCACVALLARKFFFLRLEFIRFGFIFKLLLGPHHALLVT